MFGIFDTSTSALVAQRAHMDVIAGNIANKDVTRDADGNPNPYRRKVPLFSPGRVTAEGLRPGVRVDRIVEDPAPFQLRFEPTHPDAVRSGPQAGYVRMPNVDYHTEMVNLMLAQRAYEANVSVIQVSKSVAQSSLRLIA
ncbi:MAG: flagellar basal body rod protein FlgC [Phycisphaerales bacterium]|nr:MAG: flagellar basal body rod protein FlgC [Phycisphaerales bacterium]